MRHAWITYYWNLKLSIVLYNHGSKHTLGSFIGHTDPGFIKTGKRTICRLIDPEISSFNVLRHNNRGSLMTFVCFIILYKLRNKKILLVWKHNSYAINNITTQHIFNVTELWYFSVCFVMRYFMFRYNGRVGIGLNEWTYYNWRLLGLVYYDWRNRIVIGCPGTHQNCCKTIKGKWNDEEASTLPRKRNIIPPREIYWKFQ